ncbi:MAG: nitroreductase family deazaflavin-dependent oxidoreductase [Rhizomicrobium sp.]
MREQTPKPAYSSIDRSLLGEDHVRLYRDTNGEQGYIWNGAPILLLTTRGRRSGEARTIPIIFTEYNNGYAIIASKGGSPTHPKWYLNILENPNVQIQLKANRFDAVARTAESPEREQIWAEAVKTWPWYDEYQTRTSRLIPVVVLEPQTTR